MSRKHRCLIVGGLLCIMLASAIYIMSTCYNRKVSGDVYDDLTDRFVSTDPAPTQVNHQALPPQPSDDNHSVTPYPVVDWEGLRKINPDIVGWILVPGTRISYPIAGPLTDNNFYLNHLFDGRWNPAGAIFLDARCHSEFMDANSIIYGHHMSDGTMFNDLVLFKKQSFLDEHPTGYLLTPKKNYTIDFFVGSIVTVDSPIWQLRFDTNADFTAWLNLCRDTAKVRLPVPVEPGDHVLTLSTCTYEKKQARWILQGVLRE